MGDTTLAITAGSGTPMKTSQVDSSTNHVQYVRELPADTASAPTGWTLSTTASTSVIAANNDRIGVLMVNNGNARVYLNFSSTAPTATANHWYLDPADRYEVPAAFVKLAVSFVAAGSGGSLNYLLGTKA